MCGLFVIEVESWLMMRGCFDEEESFFCIALSEWTTSPVSRQERVVPSVCRFVEQGTATARAGVTKEQRHCLLLWWARSNEPSYPAPPGTPARRHRGACCGASDVDWWKPAPSCGLSVECGQWRRKQGIGHGHFVNCHLRSVTLHFCQFALDKPDFLLHHSLSFCYAT